MSAGAGGGASVARVSTQFDVNALPQFVGHGRFVATGSLNFVVKQEQVHCRKKNQTIRSILRETIKQRRHFAFYF